MLFLKKGVGNVGLNNAFRKSLRNTFGIINRRAIGTFLCVSLLLAFVCRQDGYLVNADSSIGNVAAGTGPQAMAVNPVTNKIYVANDMSGNVTVIDGTNNSTQIVVAGTNPAAVAVNPVTNKIYVANLNSDNVTVIDGTNNSTQTIAAGTNPNAVAVNPITSKIYVANLNGNNVTVITPAPTNAIPLNTAVTPLVGNTTTSAIPTFTMTATSTYSPTAPPPQNIYFQIDTANGTWTRATNTGSTATTVTATATTATLQSGLHIIYFFASDGSDATSTNPIANENMFYKERFDAFAPESSPVIGGINAYQFLVALAPTAANVSISGRVLNGKSGISRATVSITDTSGISRSVKTNSFGIFRIEGIEAGETVIIQVRAKGYTFSTQVLTVNEAIEDLEFSAME